MPVPVPRYSKPPAHPVIKYHQSGDADQSKPSVLGHLTHGLPLPPSGPPPSFGTREDWISSLPSWRRNKSRNVLEEDSFVESESVQNFQEGLTAAGNATVIKGAHAQACIPPVTTDVPRNVTNGSQSRVSSRDSTGPSDSHLYTMDAYTPEGMQVEAMYHPETLELPAYQTKRGWYGYGDTLVPTQLRHDHHFEKGAFTPVFEDMSPGPDNERDPDSSPIGPVTPFADFVDRAVAAAQPAHDYDNVLRVPFLYEQHMRYSLEDKGRGHRAQFDTNQQPHGYASPQPPPEAVPASSSSGAYRKLAEPLSDWIASYVWKVCTTGMGSISTVSSSPPIYSSQQYPTAPPTYLASSVRSLLLSTLLQPSAIFLAMWYIVRLPIFFGPVSLRSEQESELNFRMELLGDLVDGPDRENIEKHAPFRLVVLGCMLANKWLDDHTFSNKTWHTISNVPIRSLNKLEFLALDYFKHDLSIQPKDWSSWLTHLMNYHRSLSSSSPQPISRPSSSPHSIVRRSLEELIGAPVTSDALHSCSDDLCGRARPEPVFLGLEARRTEKRMEQEGMVDGGDVLEIDLDEDGPLREEYLPRRRVSRSGSVRSCREMDWDKANGERRREISNALPPPAKWSPAADEPILRDHNRNSGQYTAVRPPILAPAYAMAAPPFSQAWASMSYIPIKQPGFNHHGTTNVSEAPYNGIDYSYQVVHPLSRSRSMSMSIPFDYAHPQAAGHSRSRSQSRYEQGYNDMVGVTGDYCAPPPPEQSWHSTNPYGCLPSYHLPHGPNFGYQPAWLRA
ncbi:hypothetical protein JAAARDRAFT_52610 [Jaapia argillacea MUCL 33604]|uniref:Cyclin N-terminal domain-containing protein n=1 Tax=Jaapia argillacea MUCL 33604 TaxID=933084 RepID=A0A067QMA9_9AGAM|nr:hypothetical protein JAAARDRAFT_52610 [Jaapia argillacea MUCL 33604]